MWFKPLLFQTLLVTASSFVSHHARPKFTITHTHTLIDLPPSVPELPSSVPEPLPFAPPPFTQSTMQLAFDLDSINDELKRTVGKKIVLEISSLLPKVDTIGHDILHANNQFIADVLANEQFSHEFKKHIILLSIKMAQYGDDLGSFFLQQYYNIVDYSI